MARVVWTSYWILFVNWGSRKNHICFYNHIICSLNNDLLYMYCWLLLFLRSTCYVMYVHYVCMCTCTQYHNKCCESCIVSKSQSQPPTTTWLSFSAAVTHHRNSILCRQQLNKRNIKHSSSSYIWYSISMFAKDAWHKLIYASTCQAFLKKNSTCSTTKKTNEIIIILCFFNKE